MTFYLFKIAWVLLRPGNLIAFCLALGIGLAAAGVGRWRRLGRAMVVGASLALLALMVLPVGSWVTAPLENRVPPAELPEDVAGIVILGGPILPAMTARRDLPAINEASERLWAGLALARRYPDARVIYSGGSGDPLQEDLKEAPVARRIFGELGFTGPRFLFEGESRNTRENAVETKALAAPQEGESWVLVTSAAHMPRSLAIFEAVDWHLLPWPVDYRTHGGAGFLADMAVADELGILEYGVREWLGLAAYRLRGWTRTFWPEAGRHLSG